MKALRELTVEQSEGQILYKLFRALTDVIRSPRLPWLILRSAQFDSDCRWKARFWHTHTAQCFRRTGRTFAYRPRTESRTTTERLETTVLGDS